MLIKVTYICNEDGPKTLSSGLVDFYIRGNTLVAPEPGWGWQVQLSTVSNKHKANVFVLNREVYITGFHCGVCVPLEARVDHITNTYKTLELLHHHIKRVMDTSNMCFRKWWHEERRKG